jgi:hypothetical protein
MKFRILRGVVVCFELGLLIFVFYKYWNSWYLLPMVFGCWLVAKATGMTLNFFDPINKQGVNK